MLSSLNSEEFKPSNEVRIYNDPPPSILIGKKDSIECQTPEIITPSILFGKKDSIECQTPKRNYNTGTITTYRKCQQDYYRFSYYSVDKCKHHIHLGNIHNPKAISIVKMIKEKQKYKTPIKQIIQYINTAKSNLY